MAFRVLSPGGATILTYHGFTDRASFEGVIDHQRMRLHVDVFRRHLEHLVAHYRVMPLSALVDAVKNGRAVPKNAVVLTFDDGYRSCFTHAHPLLVEFRVPAAFFLTTDFVFGKRALWHDRVEYAVHATTKNSMRIPADPEWTEVATHTVPEKLAALRALDRVLKKAPQRERDVLVEGIERAAGARLDLSSGPDLYAPIEPHELTEMIGSGLVEIGSHTKSHAILARCDPKELDVEVFDAKRALEAALGRPCDLFCYPNGTATDFDDRTRTALVRAGFSCALTTVRGRNRATADVMELRRVGAPRDLAEFEVAVSGLRTELARAYRAARWRAS